MIKPLYRCIYFLSPSEGLALCEQSDIYSNTMYVKTGAIGKTPSNSRRVIVILPNAIMYIAIPNEE